MVAEGIQGGSVLSRTGTGRLIAAGLALAAACLLGACGVRGALDKPSSSEGAAPTATANADSGQGKKKDEAPKPHKSFILDGLLE